MAQHRYALFGLTVASDLELPELVRCYEGEHPDVSIVCGPAVTVAETTSHPVAIDGGFRISIGGVAQYSIRGGTEIRISPDLAANPANVRLHLLGSARGMVLHQRGVLPLHANAVRIDGRAVAFLGHSGAGKSTLAAWFADRGFAVVSDDVCAVRFDAAGQPRLSPGLPRLRLWRDALERSGRTPDDHTAAYSGDPDYDKFDVALPSASLDPVTLATIVDLRWSDVSGLSRLTGLKAVEVVMANTYRGAFVALLGRQQAHLQSCVDLAAAVPVFALDRRKGFDHLARDVERLIEKFGRGGAETE